MFEVHIYNLFTYACVYLCISSCRCALRRITHSDFKTDFVVQSMTVSDIDSDGIYEVIVAVNDGPNLILQYSRKKQAYTDVSADRDDFLPVRDIYGKTVDLCACDVDGDGSEELFLLNEKSLLGTSADVQQSKLLKYDNGSFVDLLSQPENKDFADVVSGKFATCIDHDGDGAYSILLGSYRNNGSGAYMLLTANKSNNGTLVFREISREVGLDSIKDGTSAVIGQIVNEFGYSDIFITNSNDYFVNSNIFRHTSSHALFSNHGNENFVDVSDSLDQDDFHVSFGAALTDLNSDRTVDILTCSLYGPARIYLQSLTNKTFQTVTGDNFTVPSGCMNLMMADFDNDGNAEVFKDNMMNDGTYNNGLFQVLHMTSEHHMTSVNEQIDEHLLEAHIQGLTVADLNGDGILELFIGDKQNSVMSTVSIYQKVDNSHNNWLRIVPLTKKGAPARGSKVSLTLDNYRTSTFIIGGGCSRACQTEPVAHFGLGDNVPRELDVTWPDGHKIRKFLRQSHWRKTLRIAYTGQVSEFISSLTPTDDVSVHSMSKKHDISRVLLISLTFLTFYICHYVFRSIFNLS